MAIDFQAALVYPFRQGNLKQTLGLPAAGIYGVLVPLWLVDTVLSMLFPPWALLTAPLQWALTLFLYAVLAGYFWQLMGRWQVQGAEAPALDWLGIPWGPMLLDGLKIVLYYTVVVMLPVLILIGLALLLPLLLMAGGVGQLMALGHSAPEGQMAGPLGLIMGSMLMMVLFFVVLGVAFLAYTIFLSPFLMAPTVRAARDRNLSRLFQLREAFEQARPLYKEGLIAALYGLLLNLIYMVGMLALMMTVIGFLALPLLQIPAWISYLHLFHQALAKAPLISEGP